MNVKTDLKIEQIQGRVKYAQQKLNEQIVADCDPLIPFQQGALRGSLRFPNGIDGDEIMWDTPYAHYQYIGEVYGPNIPKLDEQGNLIGFWSPPEKHPTGRRLTYQEPGTGDHWFERAKEEHLQDWIEIVKKALTEDA